MKNYYLFAYLLFAVVFGQEKIKVNVSVQDFNENPLEGEEIAFIGRKSKVYISKISGTNGRFQLTLPSSDTFDIKILRAGIANEYTYVAVPTVPEGYQLGPLNLTIQLQETMSFTLNDLKFASNSDVINTSSYKGLNDLANYLLRKEKLGLVISGHTDNVGSKENNQDLSERRALAVKTYLKSKGVSLNRMKSVGYGDTQPIADNKSPEGRAKNRRTEIKTFVLKS